MTRTLYKLTLTELKLFLRDPGSAFFTLAWPLILLVINNQASDNQPVAELGGDRPVDMAVAILTSMVLGILGLVTLPSFLAYNRQAGILRRLAVTPVRPVMLLAAQLLVHLLVGTVALVAMATVAVTALGANPPAAPLAFAAVYLLGAFGLFAVGFVIAAVSRTTNIATAIGLGVFFPVLFLSGTMMPRELMPETLARIGDFTPLGPVTRSLRDAYAGDGVTWVLLAAMAGMIVVGSALAARWFRWE